MPPPQTINIPFPGGPDQKTADEYVDPSTHLLDVQNGQYAKDGAVDKRWGWQAMGRGAIPGDPANGIGKRIITRRNGTDLAYTDGDKLFAVSPSTGFQAYRDLVPSCVATREHLYTVDYSTQATTGYTVAEGSGVRAVAWRSFNGASQGGDVYLSIFDLATGAELVVALALTSDGRNYAPTVMVIGSYVYVLYAHYLGSGDGTIAGRSFNLQTMTLAAPGTIVNDLLPQTGSGIPTAVPWIYDATPYVGPGPAGILLCYAQDTGTHTGSNLRYVRLENLPNLTITSSGVLHTSGGYVTLATCRHDANLGVAWFAWEEYTTTNSGGGSTGIGTGSYGGQGGSTNGYVIWAACLATGSWATVAAAWGTYGFNTTSMYLVSIEPTTTTQAMLALSVGGFVVNTSQAIVANTMVIWTALGVPNTGPVASGGFAASKLFRQYAGGTQRCFLLVSLSQTVSAGSQSFASYLVCDVRAYETSQPVRVVATIAPRQADGGQLASILFDRKVAAAAVIGQPSAGIVRLVTGSVQSEEFAQLSGFIDLATLDFTGATNWQGCESAGDAYVSGGVPSFYDGAGVQELGFLEWPFPPTATTNAGVGALGAGVYTWAFCFADLDSNGQIHRSTFFSITRTQIANDAVTFSNLPTIVFTQRWATGRNPVIEVYRTAANGTILYYAASIQCFKYNPAGGGSLYVPSYQDTQADSAITSSTLQYTTGGVLDSVCPPSLRCLIVHKQRLWGIDDTGFVVWYSTNFTPSDAPYFNEGLTLQFSDGPLTALQELDDNLVVFSAQRIWLIAGDGPPATGQGSDLTTASPVPTDVGAADWRSVVAFPGGLFFQAPSGNLYVLGRDLSVSEVGRTVQDWMAGATVVSASMVASNTTVRFLLSTGTVITYDYVLGRWARLFYPVQPMTAATVNGTWSACGGDSYVYQEKNAASTLPWWDTPGAGASSWVTSLVKLAWVKPGGIQGWAQLGPIQGLARLLDPCDVLVSLAYDYSATAGESRRFYYGALAANNPQIAQWQVNPGPSFSEPMAVQVTLSDGKPTGGVAATGRGVRWLGLVFDVTPLGARSLKLAAGVKQ